MIARSLLVTGLLVATSATTLPAQSAPPSPTLAYSRALRALDLEGDVGAPFVVVASTRKVLLDLGNGVMLLVAPDVVLAAGTIGGLGHHYVPIDATSARGPDVFAQAFVWSASGTGGLLPKAGTAAVTIALTGPETEPPRDPPGDGIYLVDHTTHATVDVALAVADGIPPMVLGVVDVVVPTGGHALRVQSVEHAGRFTRVQVMLERPGPDEPVSQAFEHLRVLAELGVWVGAVEIVIDEVERGTSVGTEGR